MKAHHSSRTTRTSLHQLLSAFMNSPTPVQSLVDTLYPDLRDVSLAQSAPHRLELGMDTAYPTPEDLPEPTMSPTPPLPTGTGTPPILSTPILPVTPLDQSMDTTYPMIPKHKAVQNLLLREYGSGTLPISSPPITTGTIETSPLANAEVHEPIVWQDPNGSQGVAEFQDLSG
jgi:hypothetical protein